ncbi:glycosyl hydrolase [Paenibacillus donghaensis]|uniref:glycosyl hydrolase n=1 Tax=Paenibacillus donghaensis TaxID=414771 RepID=UPI0014725C0B|nr:glycosyl hydrolase [Paenibacillus donghaensis]
MLARISKRLCCCWLTVVMIAASFGGLSAPARAAGENQLSNPGFEAGDAAWEKWGSPAITTAVKHSGSKALQVNRNSGGASESAAVQEGKTYRVGMWVKFAAAVAGGHDVDLDYFGTQQGKVKLHFTGSTSWEYHQLLYTAPPGVQHIRISFWNSTSAVYYLDDVVIRENIDIERPTPPGAWQTSHNPDALKLAWAESTDDMGVEAYQLAYKKSGSTDWSTVTLPHQTSVTLQTYTLQNLEPYSVYAIMLTALDAAGNKSDPVIGLEATPGPNLVVNGGLESGGIEPWMNEGTVTVQTTTYGPYSGQYALQLPDQAVAQIQGIATDGGTSYLVSYGSRWGLAPAGNQELALTFEDGVAESRQVLQLPLSTDWTRSEQMLVSDSEITSIGLAASNLSGTDLLLDEVFIGRLPALPAELAPAAPAGLAVNAVDGVSAQLQWEAAVSLFGIKEYRVAYQKEGSGPWEQVTVPYAPGVSMYSYKLEGLSPESNYNLTVKAISAADSLSPASEIQLTTIDMHPVNPNASVEASDLLDRLYTSVGHTVYTGQHNYYEEPLVWYDKAAELTGYYPAIWGSDFAYYTGGDFAGLRQTMIDTAIDASGQGAMITLTYHQPRPMDAPTAGWESVTGNVTEAEMTEIVTPGTVLYNQWAAQIDEVAGYLAQLEAEDIPVLWRPYHEMNAEFFWWGARPELFRQLWYNMYDRLTNQHGLDNLIWVWSPNAESSWAYDSTPYYPGHTSVDVLAMDIYNNDYRDTYYNKLVKLSGGRPIAVGENGELPDLDMFAAKQQRYVYFMTWSQYLTDKNSISSIQGVYSHPRAGNNGETGNGPFVPPPAERYSIDDFEQYGGSNSSLRSKWQRNTSGNAASVTLDVYEKNSGSYGLKLDYTIGNPGYAGLYRSLGKEWPGMEAIEFWLKPDGSNRQLAVQFHETNGEVWEAGLRLQGTAPVLVRLPFTSFQRPGWSTGGNGLIDLGSIREFAFYVAQGNGAVGSGTLYIDDVSAVKLPVPDEE